MRCNSSGCHEAKTTGTTTKPLMTYITNTCDRQTDRQHFHLKTRLPIILCTNFKIGNTLMGDSYSPQTKKSKNDSHDAGLTTRRQYQSLPHLILLCVYFFFFCAWIRIRSREDDNDDSGNVLAQPEVQERCKGRTNTTQITEILKKIHTKRK